MTQPVEELATDQSAAIVAAVRWYRHAPARPFLIDGAAGTGKTYIARAIAERCAPDRTAYIAPTGKAAQVLRTKGCEATTIHSAIYAPAGETKQLIADLRIQADQATKDGDKAQAEQLRQRIAALAAPRWKMRDETKAFGGTRPSLLIVDEASMVDARIAGDIASFGIPTIALGDPYQLPPPVNRRAGYPGPADATLTTIHRYGKSEPLLDLATACRNRRPLPPWDGDAGEFAGGYRVEHLAKFDQIIVGRNATRWAVIDALRATEGRRPGMPEPGDPILVLRNDPAFDVVNGQQARVADIADTGDSLVIRTDTGQVWDVDPRGFLDRAGQDAVKAERSELVAATFAHAVTCHSAQGSQWETVAVVNEATAFGADAHRWLYTAATRASRQCIVLRQRPADVEVRRARARSARSR